MAESKTVTNYGDPPIPPPYPRVNPPIKPKITPKLVPGKGNLLYVSTLKGMAKCTGAFGDTGSDGAPVWAAVNGSSPNYLTGDALKIRAFNLDPFSVQGDHFSAMWAYTDDGLYRCIGLPDNPYWTQQLTKATVAAGIGVSESYVSFCALSPTTTRAGCIVTAWCYNEPGYPFWHYTYIWYSLDYGETWSYGLGKADFHAYQIQASALVADTFYITGGLTLAKTTIATLPTLSLVTGLSPYPNYPGERIYMPFYDTNGVPHSDDATVYSSYGGIAPGADAIRKITNAFSGSPSNTSIGDANMASGNPYNSYYELDRWMFNENYIYAIQNSGSPTHKVWMTADNGDNWDEFDPIGAGQGTIRALFQVPATKDILFVCGYTAGNVARVYFTDDFGVSWTQIDSPGGGSITTVMGLVSGDMASSTIMIDYYKV